MGCVRIQMHRMKLFRKIVDCQKYMGDINSIFLFLTAWLFLLYTPEHSHWLKRFLLLEFNTFTLFTWSDLPVFIFNYRFYLINVNHTRPKFRAREDKDRALHLEWFFHRESGPAICQRGHEYFGQNLSQIKLVLPWGYLNNTHVVVTSKLMVT